MKIGFCGTQSTGKSTIMQALKEQPAFKKYHFDENVTRWIRSLGFPLNEDTTSISQDLNMIKRVAHLHTYENIVADRSLIDIMAYTTAGMNRNKIDIDCYSYQLNMMRQNIDYYDYIFYIPIEFGLVVDGVRSSDDNYRIEIDNIIIQLLNDFEISYNTISGSLDERVNKILKVIE